MEEHGEIDNFLNQVEFETLEDLEAFYWNISYNIINGKFYPYKYKFLKSYKLSDIELKLAIVETLKEEYYNTGQRIKDLYTLQEMLARHNINLNQKTLIYWLDEIILEEEFV